MSKAPIVFPVIGGRKPEQLLSNIEALDITLSEDQIVFLDNAVPLDVGFPNYMIVSSEFLQRAVFYLTGKGDCISGWSMVV